MDKGGVDTMDARAVMGVFRRWWRAIALTTLLAAATAFVVSRISSPVYQASAALMVGQNLTTTPPDYDTVLLNQQLAKSYSELVTGRPVIRGAAMRLGLPTDEATLTGLQQAVTVDIDKDAQFFRISVRDTDGQRAADVANAILAEFSAECEATTAQGLYDSMQGLSAEMQAMQAQIESTQRDIDAEAAKPDPNRATIAHLQASADHQRSSLATFQQSLDQLRVAQARGGSLVTVFEAAETPADPVFPRTRVNVILAALVGAILATSTAFVVEHFDDTVKQAEDVDRAVGLATLATIHRERRGDEAGLVAGDRAAAAEDYRSLRAAIKLSGVHEGDQGTVLLVTGVRSGVGSSTVASNLGASLAQIGEEVLLVDANLRHSTLNTVFSLDNNTGLSSLLTQAAPAESAIQETAIRGLRVLTSGPPEAHAEEFPGISGLGLLRQLKEQAAYLLLDGPPILDVADACLLVPESDGVILVAEAGSTRRADLQRAVDLLRRCHTRILGVVLNKARHW